MVNRVRNLLPKNDWRLALADEPEPSRPEVARVSESESFAGCREGRAGTGASPAGSVVGPTRLTEREAPEAASSEEMALGVAQKVGGCDIGNAPLVHIPRRYYACFNSFT